MPGGEVVSSQIPQVNSTECNARPQLNHQVAVVEEPFAYFKEIVTGKRRLEELNAFNGKVIGTMCNFVPEELIYASGALPVRVCAGDYDAVNVGEEFLPRDICALIKSTAGLIHSRQGIYGRLDALVIPASCDGKKKLASALATDADVPIHIMELPAIKDSDSGRRFWREQVMEFKDFVEHLTGNRISRTTLRCAIETLNARCDAFRQFLELRKSSPPVVTGEEALFVTCASFFDDPMRWTKKLRESCRALTHNRREGITASLCNAPRILLTGAPLIHPNFKLVQLIELTGALVAIDELCSGTQRLYHPVVLHEWSVREMLHAIAERYLLPTTCPCFVEHTDRLNRILELAEQFDVDGVVYHNLRICPLFDMESFAIQRTLKERGIPVLIIHTDYTREDVEQLRNRVEAFIELLSVSACKRTVAV